MLGSEMLEVAIGLIFLFFILSLMLSAAREVLEGWLQTRAIHLERGVRELLNDPRGLLAKRIYDHPLVSVLYRGEYNPERDLVARSFTKKDEWKRLRFRNNLPAYIPARSFAVALLDLSARGDVGGTGNTAADTTLATVKAQLEKNIPDLKVRRAVSLAIDRAEGSLEQARANLETWFDTGMDRVSGWYRKETQTILLGLGLLIAVLLNIDSIAMARSLYASDSLRSMVVAQAEAVSEAGDGSLQALGCAAGTSADQVKCLKERVDEIGYPIGWDTRPVLPWNFDGSLLQWAGTFPWESIPGWILTALAVSLGAPFWFDLLNKIMVIRSTVKPHEKSPEESSEDRQLSRERERRPPPGTPPQGEGRERPSGAG